jgi:2-phospho-L-lactate guanylyltransferase
MNAGLIPVRSVAGAKNRLGSELDERERTRLTLAMLSDMVAAARAARRLDAVYVVSGDRQLLAFATALGAEGLEESEAEAAQSATGRLNGAVFGAARSLAARGVDRLLTIPGDVPLITSVEIDRLLEIEADVVLVPSASGTGTNGLLTTPPDVIAPRFEGMSLTAHIGACTAAGLSYRVLDLPGFALDIDTFTDLRALAACTAPVESAAIAAGLVAAHEKAA